jgi:hypothetical protein
MHAKHLAGVVSLDDHVQTVNLSNYHPPYSRLEPAPVSRWWMGVLSLGELSRFTVVALP